MREIKFRVWDKKTKKMRQLVDIVFNTGFGCEKNDNSIKLIWVKGYDCIEQKDIMLQRQDIEKVELMQYTGLKDKNGKEIYEGDIILTQPLRDKPFSQKAKSKRLRGIVKYNIQCGKNFIGEPDKIKYWGAEWDIEITDKKDYEKYHNYGWGLFFECEVIGNIYENPELVKEE